MEIKFSYLSHTVLYPSYREELKESWRRSEPWVVKRPIMFSVVFWPVVILHNRFNSMGGGVGGAHMKAYMDRQVTSLNRVTSPT